MTDFIEQARQDTLAELEPLADDARSKALLHLAISNFEKRIRAEAPKPSESEGLDAILKNALGGNRESIERLATFAGRFVAGLGK